MTDESMNTFAEIKYKPLRVFNRVVYMNNIFADKGETLTKRYIENFDEVERKEMFLMQAAIKVKGLKEVRKEVTKEVVFTYDPDLELEYGV